MATVHSGAVQPSATESGARGRRIFIFSDGTGEDATTTAFGSQSNVCRIANSLSPTDLIGREQLVFYQQGLGTGALLSNPFVRIGGLAVGKGRSQHHVRSRIC